MLKKTFVVMFAGLGLLVASGCAKSTTDAPANQPQAMGAQTDEHRQIAPLVVKLVAVGENPATGETDLRADFEVREALRYPVSITIVPPAGGLLLAGNATESLTIPAATRFSKTFKIRTQGPLSQQAPVKLIVDGAMPDKSAGLHAEPQYPALAETYVAPRQGPAVPGGRPPAPQRRLARAAGYHEARDERSPGKEPRGSLVSSFVAPTRAVTAIMRRCASRGSSFRSSSRAARRPSPSPRPRPRALAERETPSPRSLRPRPLPPRLPRRRAPQTRPPTAVPPTSMLP